MSLRDILVSVDETPAAVARIEIAADLADRCQAHLDGLFIGAEIPPEFLNDSDGLLGLAPLMTQELLSAHTAAITRAGEAAREHFEGAAGRRPHVESTWSALTAQNPHVLINHARRTDLVVVPRHIRPSRGLTSLDAAELALAAGGPVLVVPDGVASRSVGRRVLVAWNGSREAARALRDLWPLLPSDAELHVLVVSPKGQGGPDSGLQRHLEHHGRVANLIVDPSPDESAGLVLERQVAELDADLVVMGLYGRPRLQEVVLGGMSRHMLDRLPVPLLVSH